MTVGAVLGKEGLDSLVEPVSDLGLRSGAVDRRVEQCSAQDRGKLNGPKGTRLKKAPGGERRLLAIK
jgi:hypothetical protein